MIMTKTNEQQPVRFVLDSSCFQWSSVLFSCLEKHSAVFCCDCVSEVLRVETSSATGAR